MLRSTGGASAFSGQGEGDLGQGREVARTQGAVLVHRGQRAAVQG
ncbi:hypothetical protein [Streptomyces violaceusniger]|nr:hypothetical protein [Streptomyces hygroscopicus]